MPWQKSVLNVVIKKSLIDYLTSLDAVEDQTQKMAQKLYSVLLSKGYSFLACEVAVFERFKTFHFKFMESRIDAVLYGNGSLVLCDFKSRIGATTQYKVGDTKHIRQLVIYAWLFFVNYHVIVDSILIAYVNRNLDVVLLKIPLYKQQRDGRTNVLKLLPSFTKLLQAHYSSVGSYFDKKIGSKVAMFKHFAWKP